MLPSFSSFLRQQDDDVLTEAASDKRSHLTHLEDVVLDDGPSGADYALSILQEFGDMLDGGTVSKALNISVKWDGAPAIVFGADPSDGRFFVATKGAFAKTPKLAKSHSDVDTLYSGGLASLMHIAFDELGKLHPSTIVQGDVLYTSATVKSQIFDGKAFFTFQPNTILYAVDSESGLGHQIASSVIGVVVHTMYTGQGELSSFKASAISPTVFASMKRNPRAVILDAGFDDVSGSATFTQQERADFDLAISKAGAAAAALDHSIYNYILEDPLHSYISRFINANVRANRVVPPAQIPAALGDYIYTIGETEKASRSTSAGKDRVQQEIDKLGVTIGRIRGPLVTLFTLHQYLTQAKDMVVRKLGQASRVASFIQTPTGLEITGPEGFVCVGHAGKAVKLVDRLNFSRQNFLAIKAWK